MGAAEKAAAGKTPALCSGMLHKIPERCGNEAFYGCFFKNLALLLHFAYNLW